MKATIINITKEMISNYIGTFFVIKLKGQDGEYYDITPSSNINTYNEWKEFKIGDILDGLQYQGINNYKRKYFNNKILPNK